jgi:hypothetical protein
MILEILGEVFGYFGTWKLQVKLDENVINSVDARKRVLVNAHNSFSSGPYLGFFCWGGPEGAGEARVAKASTEGAKSRGLPQKPREGPPQKILKS